MITEYFNFFFYLIAAQTFLIVKGDFFNQNLKKYQKNQLKYQLPLIAKVSKTFFKFFWKNFKIL